MLKFLCQKVEIQRHRRERVANLVSEPAGKLGDFVIAGAESIILLHGLGCIRKRGLSFREIGKVRQAGEKVGHQRFRRTEKKATRSRIAEVIFWRLNPLGIAWV